jgi:hypothetical protein
MNKTPQKPFSVRNLILVLSAVVAVSGCIKGKKCANSYSFVHPATLYPVQSSYNVGDTIWVDMNVSDVFLANVKDASGNKKQETVHLTDFYFRELSASVSKIMNNGSGLSNALSSFTLITEAGSSYDAGDQRLVFEYVYLNSTYKFKLGLVCNEPGVFVYTPWFHDINQGAEGPKKDLNISPDCNKEVIERVSFPVNKQADGTFLNNAAILQQYPDILTHFANLGKDKSEIYTFVVN